MLLCKRSLTVYQLIDADQSDIHLVLLVTPRIGDKFYCNHCKKTVSKSTFYENQTLYGDIACGFSSQNVELELDMDSDSENEGALPCWDDEDRQFFSEGDSSGGENDVDDEMLPEVSSVEKHESSMQSEQQLLVSL